MLPQKIVTGATLRGSLLARNIRSLGLCVLLKTFADRAPRRCRIQMIGLHIG